ncbi:hypothetical protein HNY73_010455 [Argiope bruennichi]|uniref:Uncharacterized protein n=1 Tax=Argiope bruennichi TaxID=94029 RepID=A0A8T0F138_ARGBR|nr:hypothetical protein HNY73_010455 [Argiope bruennichi]
MPPQAAPTEGMGNGSSELRKRTPPPPPPNRVGARVRFKEFWEREGALWNNGKGEGRMPPTRPRFLMETGSRLNADIGYGGAIGGKGYGVGGMGLGGHSHLALRGCAGWKDYGEVALPTRVGLLCMLGGYLVICITTVRLRYHKTTEGTKLQGRGQGSASKMEALKSPANESCPKHWPTGIKG